MTSRPRLLVVADPIIPVPPSGYGGTERILGYLIEELATRGYPITLIAAKGSRSPGKLIEMADTRHLPRPSRGVAKMRFRSTLRRELARHDIVHSVVRLDYLKPALNRDIPKVLTFHNHVDAAEMARVSRDARGPIIFTACGSRMIDHVKHLGDWRTVHNCVPVETYSQGKAADPPYVVFLGRITRVKGAHTAIQAALDAGVVIKVAGSVGSAPDDARYFEEIAPLLHKPGVEHVGEVDDAAKGPLLGGAVALLNPVEWDEPFGIVNVEALACGTPVIAFPRGEIPEIIRPGVTGMLVEDGAAMARAIREVASIDRDACRADAVTRFDVSVMADRFIDIYEALLRKAGRGSAA